MAGDGSFFAAQNSKKNNYTSENLTNKIDYIDKKIKEYLSLLDQSDKTENRDSPKLSSEEIIEKMRVLSTRAKKYSSLFIKLKESGDTQISTTDSDARRLSKGHGSQVAYNVQISTEESNKMIADFEVTNQGDSKAFHKIAKSTKDFLQDGDEAKPINGLADKGYNDAEQIHKCEQDNIVTFIAHKDNINSKKDPRFTKSKFVYNKEKDTYQCPQKQTLTTTGKFSKNQAQQRKNYTITFKVCKSCPFNKSCLSNHQLKNRQGKSISRNKFEDAKDANKKRVEENKEFYQLRMAMVEHPFGTIKRQWGYSYTLLKGFKKVSAEFALIFNAYNLRRAISILGVKEIINQINQAEMFVFCSFIEIFLLTVVRDHHTGTKLLNTVSFRDHHTRKKTLFAH